MNAITESPITQEVFAKPSAQGLSVQGLSVQEADSLQESVLAYAQENRPNEQSSIISSLNENDQAMLDYARKLTLTPQMISQADIANLKNHPFSELEFTILAQSPLTLRSWIESQMDWA